MKKKVLILLLVAAMALTLCACGSKPSGPTVAVSETMPPIATPTPEPTEAPAPATEAPEETEAPAQETDAPAETETPAESAPVQEAPAQSGGQSQSGDNGNSGGQTQPDPEPTPEPTPEPVDKRTVAMNYINASTDDLFAAIGRPNSSDYTQSCMGDGEDGFLYYDGFTVETFRRPNGSEVVMFVG